MPDHVGEEMIRLITSHPRMALGFVSSRERDGERQLQRSFHLGVPPEA